MRSARIGDPRTSHNAAATVDGVTDAQARVVVLLARYGPGTDEDLADRYQRMIRLLGWPLISPSGLRTRRAELVDRGDVVDSKLEGRTASGRSATVWTLNVPPELIP